MSFCQESQSNILNEDPVWPKVPSAVSLSKRRAKLSYIDDLPDDVLLDVFLLLCVSTIQYQYYLVAVCRRWREFVMRTPLLWTQIRYPGLKVTNILAFFERSQPAPIDLTIDLRPKDSGAERIHNAVNQHISRLRSLNIASEPLVVTSFIEGLMNLGTPHLENISINSFSYGFAFHPEFDALQQFSPPWLSISALHTLKFTGWDIHNFPTAPNLTMLEVSAMKTTPEYFQNMFAEQPSLEKLVIHNFQACPPSSGEVRVNAPSLRSLAIYSDRNHGDDCGCALPFLSANNLEYLEVGGLGALFGGRHPNVFQQLKNIKKLRVSSGNLQVADIKLLSSLSRSTALEFARLPDTEGVLLAVLELENLQSITLTMRPPCQKAFGYTEMDLATFSRIVCQVKPKPKCPIRLRLTGTEKIKPIVMEILGSNFGLIKVPDLGFFVSSSRHQQLLEGINPGDSGLKDTDSEDIDSEDSDSEDSDSEDSNSGLSIPKRRRPLQPAGWSRIPGAFSAESDSDWEDSYPENSDLENLDLEDSDLEDSDSRSVRELERMAGWRQQLLSPFPAQSVTDMHYMRSVD